MKYYLSIIGKAVVKFEADVGAVFVNVDKLLGENDAERLRVCLV